MTPTPRSRAGRSVTSLPWRMTRPESGCSRPAMIRRMVVLPLPEAPKRTSASPTPTSKETFSSTRAFLKLLLRPRTLAATSAAAGAAGAAPPSLGFEPVAREEEGEKDDEGEERQHDGDGVGGLDLPLVELGEDVERRGLRA